MSDQLAAVLAMVSGLSEEDRRTLVALISGRPPPGHPASRAKRIRNALLIGCWAEFFPDRSPYDAAQEIATAWRRYAADAWPRDRLMSLDSCPVKYAGTIRSWLWALQVESPGSLSAETIRKILGQVELTNRKDHRLPH
ncbi:hypothetical protein [Bradyrhizobium sp. UNPA324]|uniref:hypothetical protein n=1 Tax=Bradyrhizobium sp. UNPA324 TaxID=1141174 RepID=UPI0011530F87|nr:hypothetical protein [Bradyrhizobium sp. UNPA324]TQF28865.1 hypothetical protein UNPA324_03790 [Bradyrhizobium sp. UNPA324]